LTYFSITENSATISIKDNGIGIKPENYCEIFKMFKTLHIKDVNGNYGTGLGLSSVKRL